MKNSGSIIASEIIDEWRRATHFKKLAERRKLLKEKWKNKDGEKDRNKCIRY